MNIGGTETRRPNFGIAGCCWLGKAQPIAGIRAGGVETEHNPGRLRFVVDFGDCIDIALFREHRRQAGDRRGELVHFQEVQDARKRTSIAGRDRCMRITPSPGQAGPVSAATHDRAVLSIKGTRRHRLRLRSSPVNGTRREPALCACPRRKLATSGQVVLGNAGQIVDAGLAHRRLGRVQGILPRIGRPAVGTEIVPVDRIGLE